MHVTKMHISMKVKGLTLKLQEMEVVSRYIDVPENDPRHDIGYITTSPILNTNLSLAITWHTVERISRFET